MENKVYCAFQFFNEFELLRLKLEELWDVVDYFVIQESSHTHSGKPKPFYFLENQDNPQFKKYRDKIILTNLSNTPSDYTNLQRVAHWGDPPFDADLYNNVIDKLNAHTHWPKNVESYGRDSFEKESLIWGLTNAKDYDIIILGDCDEIPKASMIQSIKDNWNPEMIYHLQHDFYWYYLNVLKKDEIWYGNLVCSYETFKNNSFCTMRQNKNGIFLNNSGWHFTYIGGEDRIKKKIESWGEQSLNTDTIKNQIHNRVSECLSSGVDLFGRPAHFIKTDITYETHPKYLVEHREEFDHLILK